MMKVLKTDMIMQIAYLKKSFDTPEESFLSLTGNFISEKTSSIDCNCDYMTFGEHSSSCPKFKKDCQI